MLIRTENESDYGYIREININAFPTSAEADLVEKLRKADIELISLVAIENKSLVGHILFSPVTLEIDNADLKIMGLGPMAVLPKYQNKGIGSKLVNAGLHQCMAQGYDAVAVLGHPNYYPKFGFLPSKIFKIKSEYDVPVDTFMIKELRPGILNSRHGTIKYNSLFNEL